MKKITLPIIALFCTLQVFAQFPTAHLDRLAKINTDLSDSWTPDLEIDSSLNSQLDIPVVMIDLFNHKTEEEDGNVGVGIYLFEKKYADTVRSYDWSDDGTDYELLETKSYIVVIDWFTEYNETYEVLVKTLIPELTGYFERNKENF